MNKQTPSSVIKFTLFKQELGLNMFLILAIMLLIFTGLAVFIRPSMYSDPGWGFLTMKSMLNGANFNNFVAPNVADINTNGSGFSAVWTPGQYLLPYLLIYLFHINLGVAIIITVVLCSILGVIGYYRLYNKLGFSLEICWLSIVVIALQRYFSLPFSIYNGGEVILFAGLPWIMLACLKIQKLLWWQIPLIILMTIGGFILKSTFLISFCAICISLIWTQTNSSENKIFTLAHSKELLIYLAKIITVVIIALSLCYFGFMRHGMYSSASPSFELNIPGTLFNLSSGLASALSLDDLFSRIFKFPGQQASIKTLFFLENIYYGILAFANLYLLIQIRKMDTSQAYKITLFSFGFVFTTLFLIFYNRSSPISSMEMRHFRPFGLVLLPGLILFCRNSFKNQVGRYSLIFLLGLSCMYGALSFLQRKKVTMSHGSVGVQGFTHEILDKNALLYLNKIDQQADSNTIIYVTSPEISLELNNARSITSHADFESLEGLQEKKYKGRVSNLFLFLPQRFAANGKAQAILSSFVNYKKFTRISVSEEFHCYKAIE